MGTVPFPPRARHCALRVIGEALRQKPRLARSLAGYRPARAFSMSPMVIMRVIGSSGDSWNPARW